MVKVKEQDLLDKGLTQADIQEFKDTGSFSDTATAKIKETMQPMQTPTIPAVNEIPTQTITQTQVSTTPTQPVETPTIETPKTQVTTPITPTPTTPTIPKPIESTKMETKTIETPQKIETIEQFKQKGANLPNLEQFIEDRYGATATQEQDGVTAVINGEKFKWTIDNAGNPIKTSLGQATMESLTPDTIFTSLTLGQQVNKNTPGYSDAKKRFDAYSMYSTMNDNQLSSAIGNGNILPGTTLYEDLMKDPVQKARIEKIQKYNLIVGKNPKTEEVFTKKSNEIAGNTKVDIGGQTMTLKQALEDGFIDQNEFNSFTNNSEIITKAKEVEELKNEYDSMLRIYKNLEKTVKKELEGTGATTTDYLSALSKAREDILPGLQELESRTNNAIGTLTQMKADSTQLFATNLGLYNQQQARDYESQQIADQRAYAEQQANKELQQKYNFTYGDFNSQDPMIRDTAIRNAVAQLYTQYPIPGMEAPAVKEQKVRDLMAQGMTGQQAISQLEQEIRATDRYKQLIAGKDTSTQDWAKLSDGTLYNQRTGETKNVGDITTGNLGDLRSLASQFPGQAWAKNNNPAGITWNANFDAGKGTAALLKEAGINYTKGTSRPASEGGNYVSFDTIEDGLAAQRIIMTQTYGNDTVEQMLGKWVGTGEALNYAKQVAGNAGIDLKTKVSDLSDMEVSQLQMAKIQKESPGLFKILNESMQTLSTQGFTEEVKNWGDNIINNIGGAKITSIKDDNLRNQVSTYIAEKIKKQPNQNIATIYGVLDVLQELETHPGLSSAVGAFGFGSSYVPGTDAKGFLAKLNQLEGKQFLEGIQQMKGMGALSNAEGLKIAAAASSLLDTSQSEADWKKELQKVKNILEGKIKTTEQDTGVKFDIYGRPLNNTDMPGSSQNTGNMQENMYYGDSTISDLRKNYFND